MPRRLPTLRRVLGLAVCLTAGLSAAAAWAASGTEVPAAGVRKSVEAAAYGVVQFENPIGTLVISGWEQPRVEVTGRLGSDVESALVERRGERVLVRLDQSLRQARSADLDVKVPAGSRLEIHGMNLDVRVTGVAGAIDANVVSGTLRVTGAGQGAPVRLETVSGVIQADGEFGVLELAAVSGPIEVDADVRSLATESGNGPQELTLRGSERVEVDSLNGAIHLELIEPATGLVVRGTTFNGVLEFGLPRGAAAEVTARARFGRVDNRLGGDEQLRTEDGYQVSLTTRLGAGMATARITLSTHRGDIVLRPVD